MLVFDRKFGYLLFFTFVKYTVYEKNSNMEKHM